MHQKSEYPRFSAFKKYARLILCLVMLFLAVSGMGYASAEAPVAHIPVEVKRLHAPAGLNAVAWSP